MSTFKTYYFWGSLHNADIYNKQESDKIGVLDNEVIYKSDGLHVLYNFFYNAEIRPTINWMFERFIFAWVIDNDETKSLIETYHANLPDKTKSEIKTKHIHEDKYKKKIDNKYLTSVESEFHHIAGRNTFGLGPNPPKKFKNTKNKKETPHFNSIDWKENEILKSWFDKVNDKLTNP